jgi:hypothetical protein
MTIKDRIGEDLRAAGRPFDGKFANQRVRERLEAS